MATAVETTPQEIQVQDRCDACGAQAFIKAVLPSGGELLFCAHHGRKHNDQLVDMDAAITDETDRLDQANTRN